MSDSRSITLEALRVGFPYGPGVATHFRRDQPWGVFPMYRLTRILEGHCTYRTADVDVPATTGDLLLIQPGRRAIVAPAGVRVHWLPFALSHGGEPLVALPGVPGGVAHRGSERERALVAALYEDLCGLVLERPDTPRAELQARLLLDLVAGSATSVDALGASGGGIGTGGAAGSPEPIPPGIRAAARALQRHPERRVGVEALARAAGLSVSQFRRVFQRVYGVSPVQYAIARRLDVAQQLLTLGGLTVKETAYQLGYPDPFSFSRQYRRHRGIPPTAAQA